MERVLVTGAAGRLGAQIVRALLDAGHGVVATDRAEPSRAAWGARAAEVDFLKADLCDAAAMQELAAKAGATIHVGAIPGPSSHAPPTVEPQRVQNSSIGLESCTGVTLLEQNLLGTCRLFEAAAAQGHRRVVFSSSLFAMGWSHDISAFLPRYLPLDEEHPATPLEHYGLSKVFGEEFAAMLTRAGGSGEPPAKRHCAALSFVSLRFSNIIKDERWGELPLQLPQEGTTPLIWAYCHEHDVVQAHLKALALPSTSMSSRCESFIIAADDIRFSIPTEELITRHFGQKKPFLTKKLEQFESLVSNKKAKAVLGMSFRSFRTTPAPELVEAVFEAPASFQLKSGESGAGLKLVYKIYGKLNAQKTNCILHPTSFDATHPELEFNVGPGKTLNTDKYCVVIVNQLGNGLSSSPSSGPFPSRVSICDNVRLQALLLDSLGIPQLAMIYGYSMGAMQALYWAATMPQRVQRVAAVCGSSRASDFNVVFLDSLEAALLADSDCQAPPNAWKLQGSCARGLKAFARIYAGWGVPREFYRQELWRKSSRDGQHFTCREDFVARSYDKGFVNANPLNLLAQLRAWRDGDVSHAHGMAAGSTLATALAKVTARVYLMPCTTDTYFCVDDIEAEARLIPNCRFLPIDSLWGHRAGDPHRPGQEADAEFIRRHVDELLAEVA